jgi:site-specific DNA-methyltransferase (adenine-specific)
MTLHCGPWQEQLAYVTECDAVITDAPFSEKTHKGALSCSGVAGVDEYGSLTPEQATALATWAGRSSSGWVVIHTDDQLHPIMKLAMASAGRYVFPMLPVLQHQPRLTGDGPASAGHVLAISRPSEKRFLSWGSLPGWYECGRDGSIVRGGKPLDLMISIVNDYSRPGDLIVDPCAGGGTTLLAAAIEGRRAIGAELDPKTFDLAVKRLSKGYTPRLQMEARPKPKQGDLL